MIPLRISAVTKRAKKDPKQWENELARSLKCIGIAHQREFMFHPARKYRADFRIIGTRLLVEVDGGTFKAKGGHNGFGFEKDRIRDADAMEHGWVILHTTPRLVRNGRALAAIEFLAKQDHMRISGEKAA